MHAINKKFSVCQTLEAEVQFSGVIQEQYEAGVTGIDVPQQTSLLKKEIIEIVIIALEVVKILKFSRDSYQVDLQRMMMARDKE